MMDTLKSLLAKPILFLLVMTLYACGGGGSSPSFSGEQPTPSSSAQTVSSNPAVTSSSATSVAPASSSSSVASSTANSSVSSAAPTGNVATGKTLYEAQCKNCHGAKGEGLAGMWKLDSTKATYAHSTATGVQLELNEFIGKYMPTPGSCTGDCALNIAAYIRSWNGTTTSSTAPASSSASSTAPASSSASSTPPVVTPSSSSAAVSSSVTPASSSKSSAAPVSSSSATLSSSKSSSSATVSSSSVAVSSSKSSSSVAVSSSSAPFVGNAANGKLLYENSTYGCSTCHGLDGKLTAFKAIDPTRTTYTHSTATGVQESLATYIDKYMPATPSFNPSVCVGQCAYDIAAYIKTWAASSSSSSAVTSSSSTSTSKASSSVAVSSSSVVSSVVSSSKSSSSVASVASSSVASSVKSSSSVASSAQANLFFSENFESTATNTQPAGWNNLIAYNYNGTNNTSGANYALVDDTKAYTGSKSIHFKGNFAQIVRALPANTQRVHMRAWVNTDRQIGNIPGDDTTSNHSHIMGIKKTTDANDEVRVGEIKGVLGTNQVPSDDIAPKQAQWRKGPQISANKWTCVEVAMYADTAYDELYFWVDGTLVHSITSSADWQNNPQPKDWLSDKFNYVEFGFQSYTGSQTANVWMDDIVVAGSPIGCGTSSSSSSSTNSSVGSSVGSSSGTTGNATTGAGLYLTKGCSTCHGDKGNGIYAINPSATTYPDTKSKGTQPLAAYISSAMPTTNVGSCDTACGNDLAAYIRSWASSSSSSSSSSSGTTSSGSSSSVAIGDVSYGPRGLRVLTRDEFVNSVYDLTAVDIKTLDTTSYDSVPTDSMVGGFSNNTMTNINSSMLQSYSLVVGKVVDQLAAQNFTSIVDCTNLASEACGAKLMESFAPKVFRRPVTDAELSLYATMFTSEYTGGDTKEGIKLALKTMFTSPQFLYRDETGISAAEIANGAAEPQYEASGTPVEVFATYPVSPGDHAGNYQGAFTFTGSDLLDITATGGKDSNGNWPTLNIEINGKKFSILINASYAKNYKLLITGVTAPQYIGFNSSFGGSVAAQQLLVLSSAKVSKAKKVEYFSPVVLDSDAYMLDPYQMATFLSYTFTGSTPDSTLLAAAAANALQTNEQVSAQVERLIATPNAKKHFGNFAAQWLRTDRVLNTVKDTAIYPKFTTDVRKAMAQEVRDYYTHVVLDEGATFTELYNGSFTFLNAALADFYGISGVTGTNMRKVTGITSRAGLVTAGAYLASNDHNLETAPILRAVNFRRQFLCHDVPAPPTGVSLTGDNVDELRKQAAIDWEIYLAAHNNKAPSRLKYELQTSATLCQTCHKEMINPLGGGMEDFDAVGVPQTTDYNSLVINAVGSLIGVTSITDGQRINFTGAKQLANEIASLDVTRQCFIDNNFRLALGTSATYFDHEKKAIVLSAAEKAYYSREVKRLEDVMKANNNSTKAMLKALGSMDSVRYRKNVTR